jgi:hypothetical protein
MSRYLTSVKMLLEAIQTAQRELDIAEEYNYHDYQCLCQMNKKITEIYSRLLIDEKTGIKTLNL